MKFKIPWNDIFDLQEYLHFCCTKCDYKSQEGQDFRTHLDETHEEKLKVDHDEFLEDEKYEIDNEMNDVDYCQSPEQRQ